MMHSRYTPQAQIQADKARTHVDTTTIDLRESPTFRVSAFDQAHAYRTVATHYNLRDGVPCWQRTYKDGAHTPIMSVWPRESSRPVLDTVAADEAAYNPGPVGTYTPHLETGPIMGPDTVAWNYLETGTVPRLADDKGELVAPVSFYVVSLIVLASMMLGMILLGVTR
jgi:hypothetical protein